MAGLYIHIPFCRKACHYCNFHFSTSIKRQGELVLCLIKELEDRVELIGEESLNTIYLGGGSPSILDATELQSIFETIYKIYPLSDQLEITVECNPEDLSNQKLSALKELGVNRLSIGIQSFFDADLIQMNRAHTSLQSHAAIQNANDHGFQNITVDLMFGLPSSTLVKWQQNLEIVSYYKINHISCYNLTIEERTALYYFVNNKKIRLPPEKLQEEQFQLTQSYLTSKGYIQYELSNYAKDGYESVHNMNYWNRSTYLGIGPSAHSFKDNSRSWNVANNAKYIEGISNATSVRENETLSEIDVINETIMLGLRQLKGIDKSKLSSAIFSEYGIQKSFDQLLKQGNLQENEKFYFLKKEQLYISDFIAAQLFLVNE